MASSAFRPRARLLQLLGDQLIDNARLALFELVKNAYDADASKATVTLINIGKPNAKITIFDDGEGMSLDTLKNIWLELGADHRKEQREAGTRSKKFHRLPLGEKGVGRFAVQKLGNKISLTTRAKSEPEYNINLDWHELIKDKRYLDQTEVEIKKTNGDIFKERQTGTKIEITDLRSDWTRGDVRRLWSNVQSISSPFQTKEAFHVEFETPGAEKFLEDLPNAKDILKKALWVFDFWFENGKFEWDYEFRSMPGLKIKGRKDKSEKNATLGLIPEAEKKYKLLEADKSFSDGIGPIEGRFYVFDRDQDILSLMTNPRLLKEYLDENGGIRVYRDGIRVHNYGEKGVDWLGLDLRRVNTPTKRISNNIIIGSVDLSLEQSTGLIEKTNREGFVESPQFDKFRSIILSILAVFENNRKQDKQRINDILALAKGKTVLDLDEPIQELRQKLKARKLEKVLAPYVDTVEKKYLEMKEVVTQSGIANNSVLIVFHEIERGVKGLNTSIKENSPRELLKKQANDLTLLLEGFSKLLRKERRRKLDIKELVKESVALNSPRFAYHNIIFSSPLISGEQKSFSISASSSLMLGALSNVIDNAIYWARRRWPDDQYGKGEKSKRALYIGVSNDFEEGPALIIADNGYGFKLPASEIVKPFMTTKPDGMGLGMYYTNMVLELNGGKIEFPEREDAGVPKGYDGAVVAFVFKKGI